MGLGVRNDGNVGAVYPRGTLPDRCTTDGAPDRDRSQGAATLADHQGLGGGLTWRLGVTGKGQR